MHDPAAADRIAERAAAALRAEADLTPKPGLVDRAGSGAHRDMDHGMLLRSAAALTPCFADCARTGLSMRGLSTAERETVGIRQLREIGRQGERAMYAVTGGVNTHRGAVFSLGILCCALGLTREPADGPERRTRAAVLQTCCRDLAGALLATAASTPTADPAPSHGMQVARRTGLPGVRGEARTGFATAFEIGLPTLRRALAEGADRESAMLMTLLRLMTVCGDSNLVYRGGPEGLEFVRREAARILAESDLRTEAGRAQLRAFDQACTARHLSPGGSADLLAMTVMLDGVVAQE